MHEKFNKELTYIKNSKIKNSLITMLDLIPEYFYEVPASSTGKYHPEFSLGKGGLLRHTKAAIRIAYELFENHSVNNFTEHEKDLIIFAITLHDSLKSGKVKSDYTKFDHPILASEFIKENKDKLELDEKELKFVCSCIETHMGEWTKDYNGNEILSPPVDKYQRFVHLCDYLASRKFLDIKFENDDIIL